MTEQVPGLSGRAEQSVFWHKHGVQVLMEGCCEPIWPPFFWFCPEALFCWSDFLLSLLCYWLLWWIWQTDLKVSYLGSFQCLLASNPPVIKCSCTEVIQKHLKTQRSYTACKPSRVCMHLIDNPSVIVSPLCVGLRGLFTMHEPWINEFIAHMVNKYWQRAFNNPQCPDEIWNMLRWVFFCPAVLPDHFCQNSHRMSTFFADNFLHWQGGHFSGSLDWPVSQLN